MRRTSALDLLTPFGVVALAGYVLLRVSYQSFPPLGDAVPLPLAALAAVEMIAARRVRAAVRHVPGSMPMAALVIARCVALGKASAVVGAAVVGGAAALLLRVLPDAAAVSAAGHDARVGALLLGAALLVTVAGLLLERSGLDPNHDREQSTER